MIGHVKCFHRDRSLYCLLVHKIQRWECILIVTLDSWIVMHNSIIAILHLPGEPSSVLALARNIHTVSSRWESGLRRSSICVFGLGKLFSGLFVLAELTELLPKAQKPARKSSGKMTDNSRNSLQTAWQNIVDSAAAMLKSLLSRGEFYDVMFRVGTAGQTEDIKAHR